MATDSWGIDDGYWDVAGTWHDTAPQTRRALRVAMGGMADVDDPPPHARPVWFVGQGSAPAIDRPAQLVLEDGTDVPAGGRLPADLPLGYHDLYPSDGGPATRVIVTPARCHLPEGRRDWGLAVQLYAARSRQSWGIGDLADLRRLAAWTADEGAGFVAVNPMGAPRPGLGQEPSPYSPSSRLFGSPLYLRLEEVPGFEDGDEVLAAAAAAGRALNAERLIDRDAVHTLKLGALEHLWEGFGGDDCFDRYVDRHGGLLHSFATFTALAEVHGTHWPTWPVEHRRPGTPGVERFAAAHGDRIRFHCWLQWLFDEQLALAGGTLVTDLPVGVHPDGFDAWLWQDVLAPGVRVGAPPDEFNTAGQDWGLPPFVPWKLRAAGYEPLARTLRASLRHTSGLRVDHVMGLFRLFWVPPGGTAADGAYVRHPGSELLDVLALESVRAGALVVGEDLGTVEPEVRETLEDRGVLSYRLVWFEDDPPAAFPAQAFAAVTTHDLPTVAGAWTGADIDARRAIGVPVDDEAEARLRERLARAAGVEPGAPVGDVVAGVYRALAASPSMLVGATLDDLLEVTERPNLPGTVDQWPNWRLGLPEPLEEIVEDARVCRILALLRAARPTPPSN